MNIRDNLVLLLVVLLALVPNAVSSQIDPGVMPVRIVEILDLAGSRLGTITVVGRSDRGFEAGYEYWVFREAALLEIADQESLEFVDLAVGEWDDPWVVEALAWRPGDSTVAWSHPAEVEWTPRDEQLPPVHAGGAYFGNATLGGLAIQYSERGPASLTWFKSTEGPFMQLDDGAVFTRDRRVPSTGSWWRGSIERRR